MAFNIDGEDIGYLLATYGVLHINRSSTTALRVQSVAHPGLLVVDTTNGTVTMGGVSLSLSSILYLTGALDLSNTAYVEDIVPKMDKVYDIGTPATAVKDIYAARLHESDTHFVDDFLGRVVNTVDAWSLTGVGVPTFTTTADVNGGEGVLATDAVVSDTAIASEDGIRMWSAAKNADIEFVVNGLSAVIQIEVQLGFYKDATHYCWFDLDCGAAAANWYAKSHDGVTPNSVDTGILATTGAHTFHIRCITGHIYFDIDGVNVADMTTNIPSDKWERYMAVKSTAALTAVSIKLDRVEAGQGSTGITSSAGISTATPNTAAYIIYKDGATYKAVNGTNGVVAYSGADFSTVIQAAIDAMTLPGTVLIKQGAYASNGFIVRETGTIIRGEGPNTSVTMKNAANTNGISVANNKQFVTIENLTLNGNSANNASGHGIYFNSDQGVKVNNCYIHDFKQNGIYFNACNASTVAQNYIDYNLAGGVDCYRSDGTVIRDSVIELNSIYGVKLDEDGVGESGIQSLIEGCWFESTAGHVQTNHIYDAGHGTTIFNNRFNGQALGEDAIYISTASGGALLMGNYAYDVGAGFSAIYVAAGATRTTIMHHRLSGAVGINDLGTGTFIFDNYDTNSKNKLQFQGQMVHVPMTLQTITAVTDIILHYGRVCQITAAADYALTSNPQIADGLPGEMITIVNVGTVGTITLRSESVAVGNLVLQEPYRKLTPGSSITLVCMVALGSTYWIETGFSGFEAVASGTATILNGQVTVAVSHLLWAAPTKVFVVGSSADTASLFVDTIGGGGGTFTVHAVGAVGGNRTIYWRAEL